MGLPLRPQRRLHHMQADRADAIRQLRVRRTGSYGSVRVAETKANASAQVSQHAGEAAQQSTAASLAICAHEPGRGERY